MLLDNTEFLTQLKGLFESTTQSGSVFLSQKRLTFEDMQHTGTASKDTDADVEMLPEASTSSAAAAANRDTTAAEAEDDNREYPIIIKATDGKNAASKTKISTIVQPEDHLTFMSAYGQLLKSSFNTMRKKDKKQKQKKKEQQQQAFKSASSETKNSASSTSAKGPKKTAIPTTSTTTTTTFPPSAGPAIPKVVGPRRGAGHGKRQRSEKARRKAVKKLLDVKRRRSRKDKQDKVQARTGAKA